MTNNFEKDINVPSKRLDRIDKMEIDLANYEQMELDIEKIIEPYQLNWELDCLSLPNAIQSILERKEQECERWKSNFNGKVSAIEELLKQLDQLKAENEELKKCYKNNSALLDFEETNTTKLVNKVMKLEKILTEIKEIAESEMDSKEFMAVQCMLNGSIDNKNKVLEQILQKISECEGNDE